MTKTEATALWRILTVLAGWDEIIDVAEIEDDLALLFDTVEKHVPVDLAPLDDEDRDQVLNTLDALIVGNLAWHEHANLRRVEDVPGCEKAGL
jgi:hypothetical protein